MEIERLARKLEPLMPDKVKHWLSVYATSEAEMKNLIAMQIRKTASEALGDLDKPLLSLPCAAQSRGSLNLGTLLYEKPKWPFGLSESELLQNLAVFGRSGAGKTNVAFHLLLQLADKGIPFLFLDWKRTGRHLLPLLKRKVKLYTPGRELAPLAFNSFAVPPGLEARVYLQQVVDVLSEAYTLGEGARSLLQKCLAGAYEKGATPTTSKLLEQLEVLDTKDRQRGWKLSATRALESLKLAGIGESTLRQGVLTEQFLEQSTILELDSLSQSAKRFLIPMICLWLYYALLAAREREQLRFVILVEEAHHVLYAGERRKESVMEMLLRQCRELGLAFVIVDQHPGLISSAVLGNTYTTICLNLKNPTDVNAAAKLCQIDEEDKHFLQELSVGQGIVKLQDRWRKPVLVQFPLLEFVKGAVGDEELNNYLDRNRPVSPLSKAIVPNQRTFGKFRISDRVLEEESFALLEDVALHRDDGVDVRYKRLGWSGDKGNRIKNELLKQGLLEAQPVRIGNTRRLLLRIAGDAAELLGLDQVGSHGNGQSRGQAEFGISGAGELRREPGRRVSRESIAHEYWKQVYARNFEEQGYQVELEAPRRSGRADILATKPAETDSKAPERTAIEIETGKSDVFWNVRQDLRMGWDVIVVATDGKALVKIERELARAGLLGIGGRVRVVVAGRSLGS